MIAEKRASIVACCRVRGRLCVHAALAFRSAAVKRTDRVADTSRIISLGAWPLFPTTVSNPRFKGLLCADFAVCISKADRFVWALTFACALLLPGRKNTVAAPFLSNACGS